MNTSRRNSELVELLRQAKSKASALGCPVLASWVRPLPNPANPLTFFSASSSLGLPRFFWGAPEQDFWLTACGEAVRLAGSGADSASENAIRYRTLLEEAVFDSLGVRGTGPLGLGGFRYDPLAPRDSAWQDFPDSLLVVTRYLLTRTIRGDWLTINTLVGADTDIENDARALTQKSNNVMAACLTSIHYSTAHRPTDNTPFQQGKICEGTGSIGREEWKASVSCGLQAIQQGHMTKVVLARRRILKGQSDFSIGRALRRLCRDYPACTVFAFDNGRACFLGASPESLARVEDGRLLITCLASSAPRGESPETDSEIQSQFMADSKERREHNLVVATLADAVKDMCQELRWESTPRTLKLPNIQHLLTSFDGLLRPGQGVLDVVRRLHPTAAVGGVPTGPAMELIRCLEGDRGWYAAPFGWTDPQGNGEFIVGIRSALLRGNQAILFAGAGIVEGSDEAREYEETEAKMRPMMQALCGNRNAIRES